MIECIKLVFTALVQAVQEVAVIMAFLPGKRLTDIERMFFAFITVAGFEVFFHKLCKQID
jgi:hypothetical protein